jgi:site-specific recombinase XerD
MPNDLHSAIGAFIATIRNPQTAKAYARALAHFEQTAPSELSRVDETSLPPFANTLTGLSAASIQLYLNGVISFFAFLVVTKQSETVSLDRARLVKRKLIGRPPKRISNYPMQELQTLVDYAKGLNRQPSYDDRGRFRGCCVLEDLRDRALILTLAETGLRKSEATGLKLSDVDLQAGQAVVIGKGDKQAVVYFGPDSLGALREYIAARRDKSAVSPLFMREGRGGLRSDTNHLDKTSVNAIVNRRAREVLGHGMAVHALRHYFVTSVWRKTGDLVLAQGLARHESIETTRRYTHVSDDELRDAHRRVFG